MAKKTSGTKQAAAERVVIEGVSPEVDAGRFPIKRTVGEDVVVSADVFADGHDRIAAVVRYRYASGPTTAEGTEWQEAPLSIVGNDRWEGRFRVAHLGRYEYTIEAWIDRFESWRSELSKKVAADQDVASELLEGAQQVRETAARLGSGRGRQHAEERTWLQAVADRIAGADPQAERVAAALHEDLAAAMLRHAERRGAVSYARVLAVTVERERARFGAWYEMFPRSAGPDPTRSATFEEAASRLPDIAAMGFDVLYLPPIHPIGRTHRKGRNNALVARPEDPGSPWAIGSEEGGHKAVEPGLGTLESFRRFVETARRHGLEVALDIAFQCSPDHPYVREHPEWFRHRPDGSIKYAENPPKKYQDIYPLDFESADWPALWDELKSVMEFWLQQGVKIFRVDNPHTKAFRFWEWAFADLRERHPDLITLSEAFTRPKVMRYLAKSGFSQSYTYFTWRNTKAELTEYFTELTQTDVREYMRPNLFPNTPDILHEYLQSGGRPAFQIRLVLAATLGASYGIYSGFEIAENRAVRPGSEEYLDSEKYQIRHWEWDRPGNLNELIARVNGIRRENAALQADWRLQFHASDNDQIIVYSKTTPDLANVILVAVNLDPSHMQHGWVQVPLWHWGLRPDEGYDVVDLLTDERYRWRGEWNYVRLDPDFRPAHILKLRR